MDRKNLALLMQGRINMYKKELGNLIDSEGMNLETKNKMLEVFVNGEYTGNITNSDSPQNQVHEIDHHLKKAGFTDYNITTQENEINIVLSTNYNHTINNLKSNLQEYLKSH